MASALAALEAHPRPSWYCQKGATEETLRASDEGQPPACGVGPRRKERVAPGVGDIQVRAGGMGGGAFRLLQGAGCRRAPVAARPGAAGARERGYGAAGGDLADFFVVLVGDVKVARRIDRQSHRGVQ